MWPRISEILFGLWLAVSAFWLDSYNMLIVNDLICALLILVFSIGAFFQPLRHLHLLNFLMGLWLIGVATRSGIPEAHAQNYVVLAVLLIMFSIIPAPTQKPPQEWEDYIHRFHRK